MTPQVKPENAWCVWYDACGYLLSYVHRDAKDARAKFSAACGEDWDDLYIRGYRCLPVEIRKRPVKK